MANTFIQYPSLGMEYLGSTQLTASAATTASVTIQPRDVLVIVCRITGYGGADIASLQFNGDTGNNYQTRFLTCAAAGTTLTNVADTATGFLRLAPTAAQVRRSVSVTVTNHTTTVKVCQINTHSFYSAAIGVEGQIDISGGGVWANTTAQITSLLMVTAAGQNMPSGSGFAVFGRNL